MVYSTLSEDTLRERLEELERIDSAIRVVRAQPDTAVGDGNRVTIFMLDSEQVVRRLAGVGNAGGFYTYREMGPLAVVPDIEGQRAEWRMNVLVHEYSHHLLLQDMDGPMPAWLVEGWAEFFSTARSDKDGAVRIGDVPVRAARVLQREGIMPVDRLFDLQNRQWGSDGQRFYATGWLLTHYVAFEPTRRQHFARYLDLMAEGLPSGEAARTAFGDLARLDEELASYRRSRLGYLELGPERVATPSVTVAALSESDGAAIPHYLALWLDQDEEDLLPRLRAMETENGGSGLFMTVLAMAELARGNPQAADEAAARAMELRPGKAEPMLLRVRALLERAYEEEDESLYAEASRMAAAANRLDPEDPEALKLYYRVSKERHGRATDMAVDGLVAAIAKAPQDFNMRMTAAQALGRQGRVAEVRRLMVPVVNDPHHPERAAQAREMLAEIEERAAATVDGAS